MSVALMVVPAAAPLAVLLDSAAQHQVGPFIERMEEHLHSRICIIVSSAL